MFEQPWFVVALVVTVIVMLVMFRQGKPPQPGPTRCAGCGEELPPMARYCRRCGKKL